MSGTSLGERFAEAIRGRDADALAALLGAEVDFVGLTPGRTWTATTPEEVVEVVLGHWFEESDHVEDGSATEQPPVADTRRVSYRFSITNCDGPHHVEQQAYYRTDGDRITWMRVLCSGFRPAG